MVNDLIKFIFLQVIQTAFTAFTKGQPKIWLIFSPLSFKN